MGPEWEHRRWRSSKKGSRLTIRLNCRATRPSVRSKSWREPRSKTDQSLNGSDWELVTPSGTIFNTTLCTRADCILLHYYWISRKWIAKAGIGTNADWNTWIDTTQRGDIGVRPASVSRQLPLHDHLSQTTSIISSRLLYHKPSPYGSSIVESLGWNDFHDGLEMRDGLRMVWVVGIWCIA